MADLFNEDFQDFIDSLNKSGVEYILVGGYAVILHGYIRSTADMDIWVNKTPENYLKLVKAFNSFGSPIFSEKDFLGNEFDVWGIGKEPNRIEILSEVKGVQFSDAYSKCKIFLQNGVEVKYIHLTHWRSQKKQPAGLKTKMILNNC